MGSTWKKSRDTKAKVSQRKVLNYARKFFAVDASRSTERVIIKKEAIMVYELSENLKDSVTKWGSSCDPPIPLKRIPYSSEPQLNSAVSLGPEWDQNMKMLVDVDALLQQQKIDGPDLACLLKRNVFQQLALVCKTRNQLRELRGLISRHKQQRVVVTLKDLHDASAILKRMQKRKKIGREERNQLRSQLWDAHAANRLTYEFQRSHPSDEDRQANEINRLIDRAFAIIANLERSGYTADILDRKSNWAR
ncbi:MAG: hypothetical protein Q9214_003571 [Letrouitia sp. 1 TL-2023]